MANPRKASFNYHVYKRTWVNGNGAALNEPDWPYLTLNEKPIICITFVKDNPDGGIQAIAYPSSGVYYIISIDNDFSSGTTPMMVLGDSNVNQTGEWEGGGNADPANGEMSIHLSGAQAEFLSRIDASASNGELNAKLEIQIKETGSDDVLFSYVGDISTLALVNPGSPVNDDPDINYPTTDQVERLLKDNIDWTTVGAYDITAPDNFIVTGFRGFGASDGAAVDLTDLEFTVGTDLDTDLFVTSNTDELQSSYEEWALNQVAGSNTLRVTVVTPSSVDGSSGRIHFIGYTI